MSLSLEEFRRLPLPAGVSVVEPAGEYHLVRMPTNVYTTTTTPIELTTTVVGQSVRVRATPVAWSWDFGDGTRLGPTREPGGRYPTRTHVHEYQSRGTYPIRMTTHYDGEFQVAGGPWQPIDGQAQVISDPHTVTVLAGKARLRADLGP